MASAVPRHEALWLTEETRCLEFLSITQNRRINQK
jgi:hypothetical protein